MAARGRGSPILAVEPDRIICAIPDPPGVRDGSPGLSAQVTWGLEATGVTRSKFSGKGVGLSMLDSGLDGGHPDFTSRKVVGKSFVSGGTWKDGHGHGTHCIGTACGPKDPVSPPRYGIAHECNIFVGKVVDDNGQGSDSTILSGVNWAILNKCAIVSMSLGIPVEPGQRPSKIFETVAQRALAADVLMIAAAGNESRRDLGNHLRPVCHPANCRSILAVGAVDPQLQVAFFSNRGSVDLAGPGVDVHSSFSAPNHYRIMSGTSVAVPFVAGIAALYAEANPTTRGRGLWEVLVKAASPLNLPPEDIGAGLVQAP
jgi:subtilisin family serine protease